MQWRALTDDEISRIPETRLDGALLWIVAAAAAIVGIPVIGFALMYAAVAVGSIHSGPIEYLIGMYGGIADRGPRAMVVMGWLVAWAAVFLVMTVLRLPATPLVANGGLVGWVMLRLVLGYGGLVIADGRPDALTYHWPLLLEIIADIAMTAAFCGYMANGRRPNAYYRRRLPTG